MYARLSLSPRKARHFSPRAGKADAKEKRNYSFLLFINTLFSIPYAGFFAKSQIMFFLHHHSDFTRRSRMTAKMNCILTDEINWLLSHRRKRDIRKLSPITGKVAALAEERGKCEQKRKKRFLQSGIKYLPVILERS